MIFPFLSSLFAIKFMFWMKQTFCILDMVLLLRWEKSAVVILCQALGNKYPVIHILDQVGEEDISEKDLVDTVKLVFQEQGILEAKLGFEFRAEQAKMAGEVLDSLIKVEHLIFEAGDWGW